MNPNLGLINYPISKKEGGNVIICLDQFVDALEIQSCSMNSFRYSAHCSVNGDHL